MDHERFYARLMHHWCSEVSAVVDEVAKALCEAAGRPNNGDAPYCTHCELQPDGSRKCPMWQTFRIEAKDAIRAVYKWHKRERRWPSFVND